MPERRRGCLVVVHFGGHLAPIRTQDASDVLHEPAFEGDGCGEKQGVERGAVEAFAHERSRGDDQGRLVRCRMFELGKRGGSSLHAHASTKTHRRASMFGEFRSEPVQVAGPLGEYQAVAPALPGIEDVVNDLLKPVVGSDEVATGRRHAPGGLRCRVASAGVRGRMDVQGRVRDGGVDGGEGVACGPGDEVPDRPDLQPDEVIELVATVGGRGQSEPAPAGIWETASVNAAAGTWWHSSTTTRP